MARTPFTLAAAVSAVVPDADVVSVAVLSEGADGAVDTVLATLSDGEAIVIRVPTNADAATAVRNDVRALSTLTPGIRALLPFAAPTVIGDVMLGDETATMTTYIDGYRVDPGDVPPGPGIGPALAGALAAVHALPVAWARDSGLVVRAPEQIREDAARTVSRADATRRMPRALVTRWRRALDTDALWQFEPTVTLGGASSDSFFFTDRDGVPEVSGVVDWQGLAVGDPARDLQWLASAPRAAADVFAAYTAATSRPTDASMRTRARLHAELEFAAWLVHGHTTGDSDVTADAEALLTSLADTVGGDDLVARTTSSVDDAYSVLDRMPDTRAEAADTSLHTDAYDPEELATWLPAETHGEAPVVAGDVAGDTDPAQAQTAPVAPVDADKSDADQSDAVTAPITLADAPSESLFTLDDTRDADEPARAARAAFHRWASSDSE